MFPYTKKEKEAINTAYRQIWAIADSGNNKYRELLEESEKEMKAAKLPKQDAKAYMVREFYNGYKRSKSFQLCDMIDGSMWRLLATGVGACISANRHKLGEKVTPNDLRLMRAGIAALEAAQDRQYRQPSPLDRMRLRRS